MESVKDCHWRPYLFWWRLKNSNKKDFNLKLKLNVRLSDQSKSYLAVYNVYNVNKLYKAFKH